MRPFENPPPFHVTLKNFVYTGLLIGLVQDTLIQFTEIGMPDDWWFGRHIIFGFIAGGVLFPAYYIVWAHYRLYLYAMYRMGRTMGRMAQEPRHPPGSRTSPSSPETASAGDSAAIEPPEQPSVPPRR